MNINDLHAYHQAQYDLCNLYDQEKEKEFHKNAIGILSSLADTVNMGISRAWALGHMHERLLLSKSLDESPEAFEIYTRYKDHFKSLHNELKVGE